MSNAKVRARRRRRAFNATPQPTRAVPVSYHDNHVAAWLCIQLGTIRADVRLQKLRYTTDPPFTKA